MTGPPIAVGVDVGGTKLTACVIDADAVVLAHTRSRTPVGDGEALLDDIARLVGEMGEDLPVGVGVPGPVSREGVIDFAPNLQVRQLDVAGGLQARLGQRPMVTNDASAALIAEHAIGAAVGHDDVVMLTVGTGVGGAVLVAGEILLGTHGYAGELGHVLADPNGPVCGCGAVGCLEAVASGSAMASRGAAGTPDEASHDAGVHLGRAAGSLVNVFDPSLVLLGGGAGVNKAEELLAPMQAEMAARIVGSRPTPPIAVATLGDDAGMIGAALLAAREHEGTDR